MVTILFPHFGHPALEERFASWQARTRFRDGGAGIVPYAPDDRACDVAGEVESMHVLVVTDPPMEAQAREFLQHAQAMGIEASLLTLPLRQSSGEEPPRVVAEAHDCTTPRIRLCSTRPVKAS